MGLSVLINSVLRRYADLVGKKRSGKKRNSSSKKGRQSERRSQSSKQAAAARSGGGRVVITHSTYLPGLIAVLEKLAKIPKIQTITPAVISRVRSNAPKFRLRVSVPITGGYKLIARERKSAQEVFVITELSQQDLENAIAQILS